MLAGAYRFGSDSPRQQGQDTGRARTESCCRFQCCSITPAVGLCRIRTADRGQRRSKKYLEGLTREVRDFLGAWLLQAKLAQSQKKYDEAIALLQNVFSRDPDNVEGKVVEAQARLGKGDSKQ